MPFTSAPARTTATEREHKAGRKPPTIGLHRLATIHFNGNCVSSTRCGIGVAEVLQLKPRKENHKAGLAHIHPDPTILEPEEAV